ncbi:angiotensin-converting enzyme isoform X2 [Bemisia tabaci]
MRALLRLWLLLLAGSWRGGICLDPEQDTDAEVEAREYLNYLNKEMDRRTNLNMLAAWNYASNISEENLAKQIAVEAENARFQKEQWREMMKYPWQSYKNDDIKRQFSMFAILGSAALPDEKFIEYQKTLGDMESIYSQAKVCGFKNKTNCDMHLEPEITARMAQSRDPEELKHYWVEWHKASGAKVKHLYPKYVELANEAAVMNNFTDTAEYWLWSYEDPHFQEEIAHLWQQLKPLYLQIHAYVRRKLREKYGENIVPRKRPIPAHLLGNMWAQQWNLIYDLTTPFPGKSSVDVTPQMLHQGYTPRKMFRLAEEFFTSMNLSAMPETFWEYSILEKPKDRNNIVCHASAWDFYDGKDYRIKQCTTVSADELSTAHHEMGHIEYFQQYRDQPHIYKNGANSGFHEAVGDVIALSVQTPKHLRKIGLMEPNTVIDPEAELNHLFHVGLEKIVFLPFAYTMDLWRWDVFRGQITKDHYNCAWWKLRTDIQGVEPPVDRSEDSFDPGAKYHIVAGVEYLRYFVSFVIQFQFHQAMCEAAGQFDRRNPMSKPLHECDVYQSKEAGNLLGSMLRLGSSVPWQKAMEIMTGQGKMDASALLQYFSPLQQYLERENKRTGEYIGWTASERKCVQTEEELERMRAAATTEQNAEEAK